MLKFDRKYAICTLHLPCKWPLINIYWTFLSSKKKCQFTALSYERRTFYFYPSFIIDTTRSSVKNLFHLNQIDSIRSKEKSFLQLFEPLMKTNPEAFEKIIPIEGDVSIMGLGLSDESRERMKDVSVVFHSAASVRFDDELYSAIILNTRGTHEVIKYAVTLSNLVSFVHVSTTYCYPDHRFIDEKVRIALVAVWFCVHINLNIKGFCKFIREYF